MELRGRLSLVAPLQGHLKIPPAQPTAPAPASRMVVKVAIRQPSRYGDRLKRRSSDYPLVYSNRHFLQIVISSCLLKSAGLEQTSRHYQAHGTKETTDTKIAEDGAEVRSPQLPAVHS